MNIGATELLVLVVALLIVPLLALIDAATTGDSVWRAADQNKVVWVLLIIFTGIHRRSRLLRIGAPATSGIHALTALAR